MWRPSVHDGAVLTHRRIVAQTQGARESPVLMSVGVKGLSTISMIVIEAVSDANDREPEREIAEMHAWLNRRGL